MAAESPTVIWARASLAFLERVDLKGSEVEAYQRVRAGLVGIANGELTVVPVEKEGEPDGEQE